MRDLELLGKGNGKGRSARMIQESDASPAYAWAMPSLSECKMIAEEAKERGQLPTGGMPHFRFESWEECRRLMAIWLNGGSWENEADAPHDSESAAREFSRLASEADSPLEGEELQAYLDR